MKCGEGSISVFYVDRPPRTFWRKFGFIKLPDYIQRYIECATYRLEYKPGTCEAMACWCDELPKDGFLAQHLYDPDMHIMQKIKPPLA